MVRDSQLVSPKEIHQVWIIMSWWIFARIMLRAVYDILHKLINKIEAKNHRNIVWSLLQKCKLFGDFLLFFYLSYYLYYYFSFISYPIIYPIVNFTYRKVENFAIYNSIQNTKNEQILYCETGGTNC